MTPATRGRRPGMPDGYWQHIQAVAESAPPLTADQRDVIRRLVGPALADLAGERAA